MSKPLFILHVGLPKTATTSLQQHFFDCDDEPAWNYLGVRQPRYQQQNHVFQSFMAAINAPESEYVRCKEMAILHLLQQPNDRPRLLSEEMLTVDGRNPFLSWQCKLQRAAEILTPFSTTVLVTVRDPEEGLRSLWIELYDSIHQQWPTIDEFIGHSNQAKVFFYHEFLERLKQCFGGDRIKVVAFELLKKDQFVASVSLATGGGNPELKLPDANKKMKAKDGAYMTRGYRSTNAMRSIAFKLLGSKSFLWRVAKLIADTIQFHRWDFALPFSEKKIPEPILHEVHDSLRLSREYLNEHYGVDYLRSADGRVYTD